MSRKLLGVSGPSSFSQEIMQMAENFFDANFVLLYHNKPENIEEWLKKVDGVIISGGVDVHPSVYGSPIWNKQNFSKFDIDRDIRELGIIEYGITHKLPMLGICRGHQMIGIYHEMELVADITEGEVAHTPHRQGITVDINEPVHPVELFRKAQDYFNPEIPDERKPLGKKANFDKKTIWVNSYHHQALVYNKDNRKDNVYIHGVAETGIKECAKIVELMSGGKNNPWISCQWHPEIDWCINTPSRKVLEKFKEMIEGKPSVIIAPESEGTDE